MNTAFRFYGKQPSIEIEKEALIAQSKYNLNDLQLAGLLQIHDFFCRIVMFDAPVTRLRIAEHKSTEKQMLPQKTVEFFKDQKSCSDLAKHFNPHEAHKTFQRFADKVLSNISHLSDYLAGGLIEKLPEPTVVHTSYEFRG
ncbi:hypothetical protein [Sulfurimonas sp.]|uniref:hypothetical protein n=1 Tax=Sulfurimonas sp. TaxID=2022749 RepID=UPI003567F907